MKQRFNYTRKSGMEVSFSFLQAHKLQLFRVDFYLTSEVVGHSTHFGKICIRNENLKESIQYGNNLTFKLSKEFIQRCWVNVSLRGCLVRGWLKVYIWEDYELNI